MNNEIYNLKNLKFTKIIKRIYKNDLTLFYFRDANGNFILFDGHHRFYFLLKFFPLTWIAQIFSIKLDHKAFKKLKIISIFDTKKAKSLSENFWLSKIFIK